MSDLSLTVTSVPTLYKLNTGFSAANLRFQVYPLGWICPHAIHNCVPDLAAFIKVYSTNQPTLGFLPICLSMGVPFENQFDTKFSHQSAKVRCVMPSWP